MLALVAGPAAAIAAEPPPSQLYDPHRVNEIDLELPPKSVQTLMDEPKEDYVEAEMTLRSRGVTYGPLEVGVRLKGESSFRPLGQKAAFKIEVDEFVDDQTIFGREELTLNSMVQDASMTHETLAYELFRGDGLFASRTGFVFLRLNGERYGVYLNIENVNDESLPRYYGSTQHLYEGETKGLDAEPGRADEFDLDEGDEDDLSDLEHFSEVVNEDHGDWSNGVADVADLEQMVRVWAVEHFIGNNDGYAGHVGNYYFHSDALGEFTMIPWGTDKTFGKTIGFDAVGGLLFNHCIADASCLALYEEALRQVDEKAGELELRKRAAEIAGLLRPWQEMEVEPYRQETTAQIAEAVTHTRQFIADRPGEVDEWLARNDEGERPPAAEPTPELRVGELRSRRFVVFDGVRLPRGGRVEQVVFARAQGRLRPMCRSVKAGGEGEIVVLGCRLSRFARAHLRKRWLRFAVATRFRGAGGGFQARRRGVVVPRVPAARAAPRGLGPHARR